MLTLTARTQRNR